MNNELLISIVNPVIYVSIRRHYKCSGITTNVMIALQIRLFMQNKANFPKNQMNVTKEMTMVYEKKTLSGSEKNKPKTNPIQTQSKPIKAKTNPIQSQYKPKQSQFPRPAVLFFAAIPPDLLLAGNREKSLHYLDFSLVFPWSCLTEP